MSYRDELGAAQERIASLERELKSTKAELESQALVPVGRTEIAQRPGQKAAQRWLGSRTRFRGERIIDGEIEESCYADIVQLLSDGFDISGRSSIVPGRLDWSTATGGQNQGASLTSISVTSSRGKTVIRGEVRLGGLAGGIYGGIGGGVGLGGIMAPGALFFVNPLAGVLGVTAWLGATVWSCRKIFTRMAKKREKRLDDVLDALEELIIAAPKRTAT